MERKTEPQTSLEEEEEEERRKGGRGELTSTQIRIRLLPAAHSDSFEGHWGRDGGFQATLMVQKVESWNGERSVALRRAETEGRLDEDCLTRSGLKNEDGG